MFKSKIEVTYDSDWSIDFIDEFGCEMESIFCQNISQKEVLDLIKVRYSKKLVENIAKFFSQYDYVKRFKIVDVNEKFVFFETLTECNSNNDFFVKNNCYRFETIDIKNGSEYWKVISNDKINFKNLIQDLNNAGNRKAKIISMTRFNFKKANLTNKQFEILKFLFDEGYFEIPKKITLDEAALKHGISKSNLNVHLNKAIRVLIKEFID